MKKIFVISWKDLRILIRDRMAWILLLAAPLIMTLAIGLVTGTLFGDDEGGISDIPVIIVDNEEGAGLGVELMEVFKARDREGLFRVRTGKDEDDARQRVDDAEFAAAVIIPAGFSAGVVPAYDTGIITGEPVPIEVYADPGQPYSAGTVISVVTQYMNVIDELVAGGLVTVTQLRENNLIPPEETARFAEETVGRMVQQVIAS